MRGNVDGGSSLLSLSLTTRLVVWGSWGDALLCVEGGLILSIINILHICLDCLQLSSYCFCDRHLPVMRPIKSELKGQQKAFISQYYSINWELELYEPSLLIQQKKYGKSILFLCHSLTIYCFLVFFPNWEVRLSFQGDPWQFPHCSIVYKSICSLRINYWF